MSEHQKGPEQPRRILTSKHVKLSYQISNHAMLCDRMLNAWSFDMLLDYYERLETSMDSLRAELVTAIKESE